MITFNNMNKVNNHYDSRANGQYKQGSKHKVVVVVNGEKNILLKSQLTTEHNNKYRAHIKKLKMQKRNKNYY